MSDPTTDTQPGNAADVTKAEPTPAASGTLTQEQVNAILARERKAWQAQQKREADEAEARRKGEFEQLAGKAQAERDALAAEHTTATERITALEATIAQIVKDARAELPEEARGLIPDGPPEQQLAWITQAKKTFARLTEQRTPGTPPGPRGNGTVSGGDQTAAERERLRQSSRYNPL